MVDGQKTVEEETRRVLKRGCYVDTVDIQSSKGMQTGLELAGC